MTININIYGGDSEVDTIYEYEYEALRDSMPVEEEMAASDDELLNCPFCGSTENELFTIPCDENGDSAWDRPECATSELWYVTCDECGITVGGYYQKDDMLRVYNRRPQAD